MAKDKKRGFFSWFGRGRQEEEQQKEETRDEQPVVEEQLTEAPGVPVEREPVVEPEVQSEPTPAPEVEPEPQVEPAPQIEPEPEIEPEPLTEPEPQAEPVREQAAVELAEDIVHITEQVAAQSEIVEEDIVEDEFVESAEEIAEDQRQDTIDSVDDSVAEDEPLPVALDPLVVLPAGETEQERPTKEGFFARLKRSLVKTKQNLGSGFVGLFRGKKIDDDLFEELEEQLLIADVGVETTRKIITSLTEHASRKQLKDADALYGKLKEEMSEILSKVDEPLDVSGKTPYVILMVGVNGVGKTTTIGKMARQFEAQGKSVMLAAGDTFRAAAVEQLQVWGQRNKIPVIAQHTGADSASVIFDAIQAAKARNIDVLIADTAGRLQNKAHLMEELKKIVRVMKKLDEDAPHEVMLTLDASTGQNAVSQAKLFNEAVGLTGITLTKLDGTAKGGVIFAIADQFSIPIRYIGVGEGIEDLRPFKADDFIEALFARED
ncbi:signal recognition particle receptor protein [Rahnella aquatilis CIP 78.65 = ATCC 33071]|uniref:Signal recognition particle receptor FtsY n=1 Tax=Rahnella aquatilis (strain ATCC 33071 / DSM 4594 / JCM 1683 / NBRC 105701 / NCIMB 13365 / CIP 78.65) TaxID=745277 RepID=H2IWL5_RAHAC|nr:signal recognition particle-docking protein FtsY [Rahnella aquatilis]AEX54064.1 signal recognition particle-docking protein FtsY [Rahnella aquatilis CIP 78.65 = ATCC 33071]KFD00427.1 signal recognition particle receptor protein [Rahnella aquatilis CIP 78.65 = ATCC 33071]